jgi:hypothetical protein
MGDDIPGGKLRAGRMTMKAETPFRRGNDLTNRTVDQRVHKPIRINQTATQGSEAQEIMAAQDRRDKQDVITARESLPPSDIGYRVRQYACIRCLAPWISENQDEDMPRRVGHVIGGGRVSGLKDADSAVTSKSPCLRRGYCRIGRSGRHVLGDHAQRKKRKPKTNASGRW